MKYALNPDDWLGRHPYVCMLVVFLLVLATGSL